MEHVAITITIGPYSPETEEILVAELAGIGYEGFLSEDHSITAYIPAASFRESHLRIILDTYGVTKYSRKYIPEKNWNADLELRFNPVILEAGKGCSIRTTGNGSMVPVWPPVAYRLVIKPELSFGTGHHPTTFMMLESLLHMEQQGLIKNRKVLDLGTGTGILAILASKMGAAVPVHALDNDRHCVHSCRDNARRNRIAHKVNVLHGDASFIQSGRYGLIMANIHRNILISEMDTFARGLEPGGGDLLLSGFFTTDVQALLDAGQKNGLALKEQKENEGWSLLHLARS